MGFSLWVFPTFPDKTHLLMTRYDWPLLTLRRRQRTAYWPGAAVRGATGDVGAPGHRPWDSYIYTYTYLYIYMIKCLNIEDKTKALQKRRMTILHFNALIWSYVVFPKFFTMDLLLFVLRLRTKTYPTAGFQGLSSLQTHTEDFCGSDMKTLLNNGKYMIYGCIWKWGIPSCKWHQFW